MTRDQLEHIIRAVAALSYDDDTVILGSQAILGSFPAALLLILAGHACRRVSMQLSQRAALIDSTIGEGSLFHRRLGYCAHGITPEAVVLPYGWKGRAVLIKAPIDRGRRLEVHDLAISKHVVGREKDIDFTQAHVRHGMVSREILRERLAATPINDPLRARIAARIDAQFTSGTATRFPS